jgi:hypothetical protein
MFVLLVAAAKYWQFEESTSVHPAHLPAWLVGPPALLVPATNTFVLLKWII